jgi:hypothetical protein
LQESNDHVLELEPIKNHDEIQCIQNLIEDWYDPSSKDYGLIEKLSSRDKFKELYKIGKNCQELSSICLRIIYEYFFEMTNVPNTLDADDVENNLETIYCEISTEQAEEISLFTIELLKVIVIHWIVIKPNNNDYKSIKAKVENAVSNFSEKAFFNLVFMVHENRIDEFEIKLEEYLDEQKKVFGNFYQHFTTPNFRLLNALIKRKGDMKINQVLFRICPFIEYNSTILTTFKEYQQFQTFIVRDFSNKTFKSIVILRFEADLMC